MSQLESIKNNQKSASKPHCPFSTLILSLFFAERESLSCLFSFSPGTEVMKGPGGLYHSPLPSPDHRPQALQCVIIFMPLTVLSLF